MNKLSLLLLAACSSAPAPRLSSSAQRIATPTGVWPVHTIAAADTTWKGADGVDLADVEGDGDLDVVTPWEQGARVSLALNPGDPTQAWTVVAVGTSLGTVEDARFGDVDGDGCVDIVSVAESRHVWIHFQDCSQGPAPAAAWTTIDVTGGNLERWLACALADMDADGHLDIVAGGKDVSGYPGSIEIFTRGADPRDPSLWTRANVAAIGWPMSLLPRDLDGDTDLDLLVSDRKGAGNQSSQKGTWWYERTTSGWTAHHVAQITGDPGYLAPLQLANIPAAAIVDGNRTALWYRRTGWGGGWLASSIAFPADVGDYHAAAIGDVDADGVLDLALTFALTDASGVVWLKGPSWTRYEISGTLGHKYDNLALVDLDGDGDLDVVTAEGGDVDKTDDLGVVWFEHP